MPSGLLETFAKKLYQIGTFRTYLRLQNDEEKRTDLIVDLKFCLDFVWERKFVLICVFACIFFEPKICKINGK